MSEEHNTEKPDPMLMEQTPSRPGVISRILRTFLRIVIAVVIGLALGGGLYYGALRIYREAIEPIQSYGSRIDDLESSLAQLQDKLRTDSAEIGARQAEIEGGLAEQSEAVASAIALIEAAQTELREQRAALRAMGDLQGELEDVSLALGAVALQVEQLEADILSGDLPARKVQRTAVYLRAMTLLTRARLELDRANLGFAREQVEAAKSTLSELAPAADEELGDEQLLADIQALLDRALQDLPLRPGVAGDVLEAAWGLLQEALQPAQPEADNVGGE